MKINKLNKLMVVGIASIMAATCGMADDSMKRSEPVMQKEAVAARHEKTQNLFWDDETSVDLFGSYTDVMSQDRFKDGFGGGLGANHFFTKYVGLGLDAYAWDGDRPRDAATVAVTGSVILRYPMETLHLAPYIFGGAGGIFTKSAEPQIGEHVGLGAEYRFTKNWGVFADVRYTFAEKDNDYVLPRVGVRFIF